MDRWDEEVDVLVVGSGAGGMVAALRAADLGARTLLIEKSRLYGGATAMSGGVVWLPNNHRMAAVGSDDSEEEAVGYRRGLTEVRVAEARILAYVREGVAMPTWVMTATGARF